MPNPLNRLCELWAKKPHTKPPGLREGSGHWVGDYEYGHDSQYGIRLCPNIDDLDLILSLAESRLLDLLPEWWDIGRCNGEWHIAEWNIDIGDFTHHSNPDRLSALIAFAESDNCKEVAP